MSCDHSGAGCCCAPPVPSLFEMAERRRKAREEAAPAAASASAEDCTVEEGAAGDPDSAAVPRHAFAPLQYDRQLEEKRVMIESMYAPFLGTLSVAAVPTGPTGYRVRCKFRVASCPTVPEDPSTDKGPLTYWMRDGGEWYPLSQFPVATNRINDMMAALVEPLSITPALRMGLNAVCFLDTVGGPDILVTLVYKGSSLPFGWMEAAEALQATTGALIQGRAKGVVQPVTRNYVIETLTLSNGRKLEYKQVEGVFSNPNARGNVATLDFLTSCAQEIVTEHKAGSPHAPCSLLELYCGNGNHSIALATVFSSITAVEIAQPLCTAAEENCARNGVSNVRVVCVPSERFAKRALYRLRWERNAGITDTLSQSLADDSSAVIEPATSKDLTAGTTPGSVDPVRVTSAGGANPVDSNSDDVTTSPTTDFLPTAPGAAGKPSSNGATARGQSKKRVPLPTLTLSECGAVLVDPPRDGLDPDTLALIACFPHILYISCNHASLLPALTALSSTHTVRRMVLLDLFPYTKFAECGVWLQQRPAGSTV